MSLQPFVLLLTLISLAVFPTSEQPIDIEVNGFSDYLEQLMDNTGVKIIEEQVNQINYSIYKQNGLHTLNELVEKISQSIQSHVEVVNKLVKVLTESLHKKESNSAGTPCCQYPQENLKFNENFNKDVDTKGSCWIAAPSSPNDLHFLPDHIVTQMENNRVKNPLLKWQYVASYQGVLTAYPGFKLPQCDMADPRFRTWYVTAAQRKPKRMLILLDVSRSMNERFHSIPLIDIARNLIDIILKTLTPIDKVNVIAFNSTTVSPKGCFNEGLGLATASTKAYLTDTFLKSLNASGESMYAIGFEEAFNMLNESVSRDNTSTSDEFTIVFISDGKPKEQYHDLAHVYRTISEGNSRIGYKAKITTYGIGRNANIAILDTIATQKFVENNSIRSRIKGSLFLIHDPEMLENVVSLADASRNYVEGDIAPTISAPYIDLAGLGLIFTISYPLFYKNSSLYGVLGVDITMRDFLRIDQLLNNSQHSYSFIIDNVGRVFTHPLLQEPVDYDEIPDYITIDELEREEGFQDIMEMMLKGENGTKALKKKMVFPLQDKVKTITVNATYFWKSIPHAKLVVCLVVCTRRFVSVLQPEVVAPLLTNSRSKFYYHRFDLSRPGSIPDLCRHFNHNTTLNTTIVLFSPSCYTNNPRSLERESPEMVEKFIQFFNKVLKAHSADKVSRIIEENRRIAEMFVQGVISDVMWTSLVDRLWLNKSTIDEHVAQRYVGTKSGTFRIYPGTTIRGGFDPRNRHWYQFAEAHPGQNVMTPPYADAGGVGIVVSMSRTIRIKNTDEILGVMAVDFSLDYLYSKLISLYPSCSTPSMNMDDSSMQWECSLVDDNGNVLLHPDYTKDTNKEFRMRHIAEDPFLVNRLLELGYAKTKNCIDLHKKLERNWLELNNDTFLNDMNSMNPDICSGYSMKKVYGTNIFLLVRFSRDWCYAPYCPSSQNFCSNVVGDTNVWLRNCPCNSATNFNLCQNSFPTDRFNCSTLVDCIWCYKTVTGGMLEDPQPHCAVSEECRNGIYQNPSSGYDDNDVCPIPQSTPTPNNLLYLLFILLGLAMIAIIVVFVCIKRRRKSPTTNVEQGSPLPESGNPNQRVSHASSNFSFPSKKAEDGTNSRNAIASIPVVTIMAKDPATGKVIFEKRLNVVKGNSKMVGAASGAEISKPPSMKRTRSISLPTMRRIRIDSKKNSENKSVVANPLNNDVVSKKYPSHPQASGPIETRDHSNVSTVAGSANTSNQESEIRDRTSYVTLTRHSSTRSLPSVFEDSGEDNAL